MIIIIQPIPFTYNTGAVTEKAFQAHMKLYRGYVEKVNGIAAEYNPSLWEGANATCSQYRELKKGQSYASNGVILHELYFGNMHRAKTQPMPKTIQAITTGFGSVENFFNDFMACAKSARGWCVFSYCQRTDSFTNILLDSHDEGVVMMAYPILVLDMYEHAYYYDYLTDKEAYIKQFIVYVNWGEVEKRVARI